MRAHLTLVLEALRDVPGRIGESISGTVAVLLGIAMLKWSDGAPPGIRRLAEIMPLWNWGIVAVGIGLSQLLAFGYRAKFWRRVATGAAHVAWVTATGAILIRYPTGFAVFVLAVLTGLTYYRLRTRDDGL